MRTWLIFIAVTLAWSAGAGFMLNSTVHPLAIFVVWIVGVVWLSGWIIAGPRDADRLVRTWLIMLGGLTAISFLAVAIVS